MKEKTEISHLSLAKTSSTCQGNGRTTSPNFRAKIELARMGGKSKGVAATEVINISQLNTVQDILMSPLPIMMEPLNFDDRYDLFYYLRLLEPG